MNKYEVFLKELTELSLKHGLVIEGCLCGCPHITEITAYKVINKCSDKAEYVCTSTGETVNFQDIETKKAKPLLSTPESKPTPSEKIEKSPSPKPLVTPTVAPKVSLKKESLKQPEVETSIKKLPIPSIKPPVSAAGIKIKK